MTSHTQPIKSCRERHSHGTLRLEGYSTGMVDANKHGHAAHHTRPFPLELVGLAQTAVDAGIQQPDHRCREREQQEGETHPGGGTVLVDWA